MPGPVLTLVSTVTCAHAGKGTPAPVSAKVSIDGQFIATIASQYTIAACTFPAMTGGNSPPCVSGTFTVASTKVTSDGQFVLIVGSTGTSLPNGTPLITAPSQIKVVAS